MAGVDMVHVPYRGGGPALTGLLGGKVQVMFVSRLASIEYIRAGRLRAIGVLRDLVRDGLATAASETTVAGRRRIMVTRLRITGAGRLALAGT